MCGIIGIFSANKTYISQVAIDRELMMHRGPDGFGEVRTDNALLFHRRLSIIDPNPRSNQPMQYGDLYIIFNGEIYNYRNIKALLESIGIGFDTGSDTEVILKGFSKFGTKIFSMLKGMFGIVLYDGKNKKIYVARDFVGEKPLSFFFYKNKLILASEPMAIARILLSTQYKLKMNKTYLQLLNMRNIYGLNRSITIFNEVKKIVPGFLYIFKIEGSISLKSIEPIQCLELHEAPLATKKLERIIEAGVAQSCEADVPLGVLLSGGIDSTLVSYLAKKNGGQITNAFFLFTGKNDDELKIVERIAEDISLKLNVVDINDRDFLHYLKNISKNSGEILTNVSFALNALLTKQANKKKIKVLLSGAGGDEIFFGYPPVNWFYILNNYNPFIKLIRHPIGYVKEYGIEGYKEYYRKIMEENVISRFDVAYVVDSEFDLSRTINVKGYVHPLKIHALFSLLSLNSHSVVMAGDLGGMANSVEIRAPLLHYDIISNAFGYRTTDFLDFFTSKKVLKDMLKKTELSYVLNLKKTGFGHQMMLNQILEGMEDELKEANEILHRLFPHLKISNTPKNKLMALQFKNIVDIIEYRSL